VLDISFPDSKTQSFPNYLLMYFLHIR